MRLNREKVLIVILVLFPGVFPLNAQTACIHCEAASLCKETIGNEYTRDQKKLIKKNWSDFEGQDLEYSLPDKGDLKISALKFDGIGCVYPSFVLDNRLKKEFLQDRVKRTYFRAFIFFSLELNHPGSFQKYQEYGIH